MRQPFMCHGKSDRLGGRGATVWGGLLALLLVASGCGVSQEEEPAVAGRQAEALRQDNRLSLNGLSLNGLSTASFRNWFSAQPALSDEVMRYLVRCAVPEGETRVYVHAATGKKYVWEGELGLTPQWAGGAPATPVERQLISACLLAHVNTYGMHMSFSLLGRRADGSAIPWSGPELDGYDVKEACFFGNLFEGGAMYAGNAGTLGSKESTLRRCGLSPVLTGTDAECPPVIRVAACSQHCTKDASGTFYDSCSEGGISYRPLLTRIRKADILRCGDGICQPSERCGKGTKPESCGLDCGVCP